MGKNRKKRTEAKLKQLQEQFEEDLSSWLYMHTDANQRELEAMAILLCQGWCLAAKVKEIGFECGILLVPGFQELAIEIARDVYRDLQLSSTYN